MNTMNRITTATWQNRLTRHLELAQKFLNADDAPGALEVLKAAAEAFQEATDNLDDYVLEVHEEMIDEQLLPFAEIWTESLLSATWTHEQKIYWLEELEKFIERMFGGSALMMAQTALQHGWTYSPLVAAMRGYARRWRIGIAGGGKSAADAGLFAKLSGVEAASRYKVGSD